MGFWTQPLGKTLAERKGRPYFEPILFGASKGGLLQLTIDGYVKYQHGREKTVIDVADITSIEVEDGADLVRRSTVARTGGGAVVGGLLLGPVGLLAGLGVGAVAKKQSGGEKFIVIEAPGQTVFAEVPGKDAGKAHQLRAAVRAANQ